MGTVTIILSEEQTVFAMGALQESIDLTEEGRCRPTTRRAGVEVMYEENIATKVETLVEMRASLGGRWDHLDDGINETITDLARGWSDNGWNYCWYRVWSSYDRFLALRTK